MNFSSCSGASAKGTEYGGKDMAEIMTDKQFDKIIQMFEMILEGCKDLDDAKRKVKELREDKKEKAE